MPKIISRRLDEELKNFKARLFEMGDVVESQVQRAIKLLHTGDLVIVDEIFKIEKSLNKTEVELDTIITQLVARWQPAAVDLRFLMAVSKVLTDLERVGDEAKKIANNSRDILDKKGHIFKAEELTQMGEIVVGMLHRALEAFCGFETFGQNDATVAVEISYEDHRVDDALKAMAASLVNEMRVNPDIVDSGLEVLSIAKSFERIGDHAKNIAEYVVYLVHGRYVRHYSAQKLERKIEKYSG